MTRRTAEFVSPWPGEVNDAADSGALTRIELPTDPARGGSWKSATASQLLAASSLDDAYQRFIAVVDAYDAVHVEVEAVFAGLRDLQGAETDQSTTAARERLNGAWQRLDGEILHLADVAPRSLDAVSSVTSDLYQVLRQILAHGVRIRGGTPAPFNAELEALTARLARHDRYAKARQEGHP